MGEIKHRNFGELFCDAIFFERLSRKEKNLLKSRRYARTSIIMSALTLESAANCCVDLFEVHEPLMKSLDKMPFLSKFDIFALHAFDKKIDYGRVEIKKIKEIKTIRDIIVHPKVTKSEIGKIENKHRAFYLGAQALNFSIKPKSSTNLIEIKSLLSHSDSMSTLKSIIGFYNYFFTELLNMDKGLVFGMLNDSLDSGEIHTSIYPPELFDEITYLMSFDVDITFIVTKP